MSNVRSLRVLGRRSLEREWLLNSLFVKMRHPCEVCSTVTLGRAYATASKTETPAANRKTVLKAADIAKRLRSEKEKQTDFENEVPVSPLQKRVIELKQLTQQLQTVHPSVLAKALYRSILYQDPNLIAINKPYGVPIHNVDGIRNSIAECLPLLAKIIDGMQTGSQLHLCHRLEKETTGVLILAKTEQAAEHVQTLIRSHQVESKYLAVTVGVPVPSEGVIDIPIIEREVMGPQPHFKMGLSPLFRVSEEGDGVTRVRSHRLAQSAVTQYRVLDSTGGCSLVELQPVTGVKNQLRVHMALALACPILGDHKYAHWDKLAPQKLPEGVLRRLGLVQSKTRYLPLHLHSRKITLPGVKGHSNITVSCPLPKYFTIALKRLQIPLPGKE
ncbi:pseudouridylate synthase RPUSD4, mitochondrial-like [Myxocyprinus asiaticus]|uniref:pseudouridylate synthase RPUSD4, mitochondrial-like n=1 Tax=Myxocyprinus asiaticus TaxID=70543 RepID=UPI002221902C|nr:pseudouridylate synthase RPUSD4, mitochondrial-like [Myxocyprinus asiaticus]